MKRTVLVGVVAFVLGGLAVHAAKTVFDPKAYYAGKSEKEAVAALLTRAEAIAGNGSWERIGVGRVYYLSGDKAKGQALFDGVLKGKVAKSDLYRIADVYAVAGEWDKAKPVYERALAMDPGDDAGLLRVGCWYNLNGDRAHAEELFDKAFARSPNEVWHYELAAGSYVGVKPF